MTPLALKLRNFRSYAEADITIGTGCIGLTGPNGAGKSSIIEGIDVALFGPDGRSFDPYIRQGETDLLVELLFDHTGETYRARRAHNGKRATFDLERLDDGEWSSLTQGNIADTQAELERILGLTRETLRASAFLRQGQGGAFTEAQPKDRKRVLADALALTVWDEASLAVSADRRSLDAEISSLDGRVASLAERVQAAAGVAEQREAAAARLAGLDQRAAQADELVGLLDERHEQARAADEQWRARSGAVATAEQLAAAHRRLAVEAQVALERLDGERTGLVRLEQLANEHMRASAELERLEASDRARAEALRERDRLLSEHGRLIHAEQRHEALLRTANEKLRALEQAESPTCPTCEQHLPDQARETALASLRAERDAANGALADAREQANVANRALIAHTVPDPVAGLDELRARLTEIAGAPQELAAARARITELERTASLLDDPAYREEQQRLDREYHEASRYLRDIQEPEPGTVDHLRSLLLDARAAQESVRSEQQTLGRDLARLDALADAAHNDADALDAARAERDQHAARHDDLALLERAFGRDGVPQWIVEHHALPAIETEANRILTLLGGPVTSVELRTERELKTGGVADALDIVCVTDDGARDYATFSGGERTRIGLALRIGLARLLAHRASEIRVMLLDEPEGLDSAGTEALAGILRDLVERSELESTVLASHDTTLRDRFDQALIVERDDTGSRVVAA